MPTGVEVDLSAVWASSPRDIWVAGDNGVVLHCDGKRCSLAEHDLASNLEAVSGNAAADIYVGGWAQGERTGPSPVVETRVYHYDGKAWTRSDPGFQGEIFGLSAVPGAVYAAGMDVGRGRIWFRDHDQWAPLENPFEVAYAVWAQAAHDAYFVGSTSEKGIESGAIFHFDGNKLNERQSRAGARYTSVFGIAGQIFVGGDDESGKSLIEHLRGSTLISEQVADDGRIDSIFGTSPSNLWAVGARGAIYRRDGSRWKTESVGTEVRFRAGFSLDPVHTYAVGQQGKVLRYDCESALPPDNAPSCQWMVAGSLPTELCGVWQTTSGRLMLATVNGVAEIVEGQAAVIWQGSAVRIEGIGGTPEGLLFVVGGEKMAGGGAQKGATTQTLVVRCEKGVCAPMDTPFAGVLYAVLGLAEDDVFAVGMDESGCSRGIHYDGTAWTAMDGLGCFTLQALWGVSGDDVWAGGTVWNEGDQPFGRILHYDGFQWRVAVEHAPVGLVAMAGRSATEVYAVGINETAPFSGGDYGTIMRFDGTSWSELVTSAAKGYTSAFVDSSGALWAGARSWNPIERDSRPEIDRLDGDAWTVFQLCDASSFVTGVWVTPNGRGWAVEREGALLSLDLAVDDRRDE